MKIKKVNKMKKSIYLFAIIILALISEIKGQVNCGMTITNITVIDATTYPNFDILVTGSAHCNNFKVKLCCPIDPNEGCVEKNVTIQGGGTWSATFDNYLCRCANEIYKISATVICLDEKNCIEVKKGIEIKCPTGNCCAVTNVITTIGVCIDDVSGCKKRQVTFNPVVSGNCDFHTWNFGDNSPGVTIAGPPTSIVHDYFHYPQSFPTLTTIKAGCNPPGSEFQVTNLQNFPICDDCPVPTFIDLNQISVSNCKISGNITANFCEEQYLQFIIDYGDGHSETKPIDSLNGLQINHDYLSNDTFQFKIILQKNGTNCPYTKDITINNCGGFECPSGQHWDNAQQKCVPDVPDVPDDCTFCFCSESIWCCIAYIFFILALISTMIGLAFGLCNGNTAAWVSFGISLAIAIGLAVILLSVCDVGICAMLIAIASAGTINWGIICGTSLIPCTTWLCAKTTIPIFGGTQNFLIVAVVLWLLTLIFCNT